MPVRYPPWNLDKEFPFGKYKGDALWLVIDTDPSYIDWCIENIDGFELNNEAFQRYRKQQNS